MVGINVPIPVPVAFHSFGGWKRSSFGSHGIYGPEAVHFYTRLKTTTTRWPEGLSEGAVFTFQAEGRRPPAANNAGGHERFGEADKNKSARLPE